MGILHSVIRFLGCITDEEDGGRPQSPLFPQANRSSSPLSSCHYYLNIRENLDQYAPRTNNTVVSTGKNLDQYASRTNNAIASTCQWQNGKTAVSGEKGEKKERVKEWVMFNSITDKENGARPQSLLFPQANRSSSSPSSCHYYLNTGKNLDQYASRTNNTVASTRQWQNGKTTVSGEKGEKNERVKERVTFNFITDKEDGGRPQSPLFPQANRSSSSPSSRHYYLNTRENLDQYAPRTNSTVASPGKNLDQYAPRTNNNVAYTCQWQNGKTAVSGEKGKKIERVNERVMFKSITDKEDGGRPQSPLLPQANRSSSSPSSCRYCLNTGKNSDEYAPQSNNTVVSTRQWQNGKTAVSGKEGEKKDKVKEQVMFNSTVAAAPPQERWIKHYSSNHRILLVGEGDFSFSTCLAETFGSASNMIATSLNSPAFLVRNYQKALSNIMELTIRKCKVLHEVDATDMANHEFLRGIKFDRIIYNFPHAGFFKNLSRDDQLLLHRKLVGLFLKNAKEMLGKNGQIHITHKTNSFHKEWHVESIARRHKLSLIEAVQFSKDDYPGYNTKYGFGGDNNFDCNPAKTYKFGLALVSY